MTTTQAPAATQRIIDTLTADGYAVTSYVSARSDTHLAVRAGSRLVTVDPTSDGQHRVVMWIDYGDDGRSWCDGVALRSVAGVVRRTRGFLGTVQVTA